VINEYFKTFVVVNPNSSNGTTGKVWPRVSDAMKESLGTFDHVLTSAPQEASERVREALGRGYEMIVSVGGDGTHNEVVNGFFDGDRQVNPAAVMAIVTSGTGGDFRRTFGLGKGPFAAIERLSGRETRPIDVGRFSYVDHQGKSRMGYFVNILSFGMGGLVDHMINNTTKAFGGKTSFFIATLRALCRFRRQTVEIALDDGEPQQMQIHNVAVANGRFFGGGMMVAPEAEPDDGLFDIVSFVDMSTLSFMSLGSSIYKGKHLAHKNVTFHRARKLTATSEDAVLLDVDGEQAGILPVTIENLARTIKLKT